MTQPGGHDPAHPGEADMLASLAAARAILTGAVPGTAHQAAATGTCAACAAVAGLSFWINLAARLRTGERAVSRELAAVMLAAVDAAEDELRGSLN